VTISSNIKQVNMFYNLIEGSNQFFTRLLYTYVIYLFSISFMIELWKENLWRDVQGSFWSKKC